MTLGLWAVGPVACGSREWVGAQTEHLVLRYEPGSYAAAHLDEARDAYEAAVRYALSQLPFVTPEQAHFVVYLHETLAEAGHANRSDRSVHYVFSEKFKLTSAHEMMHHFLFELNPRMPLRFEEGVCRLYERRSRTLPDGTVVGCDLSQLAKALPRKDWTMDQVFQEDYRSDDEGNLACAGAAFLMRSLGPEKFWRFYRETTPDTLRENIRRSLDLDLDQADRRFAEFVQRLPDAPPELIPRMR